MALTKIPVITREFYRIPVELTVDGSVVDPTGLTVEFAIVGTGITPSTGDWVAGSWETLTSSGQTLARILVGDATTDFPLVVGTVYDAWLRITDSPERPARLCGTIQGT